MGIEKFFSSIETNNITNFVSSFTYKLGTKLETEYLCIDFNSIIHVVSSRVLKDLNNNSKSAKITIDEMILNGVEEYFLNIVTNFVEPSILRYLYVAIDGVPTKAKMLEQKKRRYMATIIEGLKKQLFNKYQNKLDSKRREYEINKYEWSKLNISPATKFMQHIHDRLTNKKFIDSIYKICSKLEEYSFSGSDEYGEGEKKIVEYLHDAKSGNCIIYSPDSDMSLLALILHRQGTKILRHNQQYDNYDVIDVDQLSQNLYEYCSKLISTIEIKKKQLINDIVFVLTIFGNDFLPKLESFNVKHDFNRIIDKYMEIFDGDYLIEYNEDKKTINQKVLTKLFEILAENEGANLQKMYMVSNYRNYNKLKEIIGANEMNFTKVMIHFLETLRRLNNEIKTGTLKIEKWKMEDDDFIHKLTKLVGNIDSYVEYYHRNGKFPYIGFKIRTKKISDDDVLAPTGFKTTEYDIEIYKLEHMMDKYKNMFNANSLRLGFVGIDPRKYVWISEKIATGVDRYYRDFFDISLNSSKLDTVMNEYLEGLIWVFDYYFNRHSNLTSYWFYRYSHAPLLTQLYNFLKRQHGDYVSNTIAKINKYWIPAKDYFQPMQHLIYITPVKNHLELIPKSYHQYIMKSKRFVNLDRIIQEIWENNAKEIDCRGVTFLNKCHLAILFISDSVKTDFNNDTELINTLRQY